MAVESATKISDLNANWPLGTDQKLEGDDHIRLIKSVLKATFPANNKAPSLLVITSSNPAVAIPAGCTHFEIEEAVGGGGAGGGGTGTATTAGAGGGGGSGAYGKGPGIFDVAALGIANVAVVIGAAGTSTTAPGNGNPGGSTTIQFPAGGTVYTWGGGQGGSGAGGSSTGQIVAGGQGGTATNVNAGGWSGEIGVCVSGTLGVVGSGGSCPVGRGGASVRLASSGSAGSAGGGFGSGGSGAGACGVAQNRDGAGGTAGYMRLKFYYGMKTTP